MAETVNAAWGALRKAIAPLQSEKRLKKGRRADAAEILKERMQQRDEEAQRVYKEMLEAARDHLELPRGISLGAVNHWRQRSGYVTAESAGATLGGAGPGTGAALGGAGAPLPARELGIAIWPRDNTTSAGSHRAFQRCFFPEGPDDPYMNMMSPPNDVAMSEALPDNMAMRNFMDLWVPVDSDPTAGAPMKEYCLFNGVKYEELSMRICDLDVHGMELLRQKLKVQFNDSIDSETPGTWWNRISHKIVTLLRHKGPRPADVRGKGGGYGMAMNTGGWVLLSEVAETFDVSVDDVVTIAALSGKHRIQIAGIAKRNLVGYSWVALALIRATQGHSIRWLNPFRLFCRLSTMEMLAKCDCIMHGTRSDNIPSILANGLAPGGDAEDDLARAYVHFSPFPRWDSRCVAGMRKDSEAYVFLDPVMMLDAGPAIWIAPTGALMVGASIDPEFIECVIVWTQSIYDYEVLYSKSLSESRPLVLKEVLEREGRTPADLPLTSRPGGEEPFVFPHLAFQNEVDCPYCRYTGPRGATYCFSCCRELGFRPSSVPGASFAGAGADSGAGFASAGSGGASGSSGATAGDVVVAAAAVAAPAAAGHPAPPGTYMDNFLRRAAYRQVARSTTLSAQAQSAREARFGVLHKRSALGKFLDSLNKNRNHAHRWQSEPGFAVAQAAKGAIGACRGTGRCAAWVPESGQVAAPDFPFTFVPKDAQFLIASNFMGRGNNSETATEEERAIYFEKMPWISDFSVQNFGSFDELWDYVVPGVDLPNMTLELLTTMDDLGLSALHAWEVMQWSLLGAHRVHPWIPR